MKRSLAHLPEHKRDELKRVTDIIIELVPTAQKIILFGSYARGGWVEDVYGEDGVAHLSVRLPRADWNRSSSTASEGSTIPPYF